VRSSRVRQGRGAAAPPGTGGWSRATTPTTPRRTVTRGARAAGGRDPSPGGGGTSRLLSLPLRAGSTPAPSRAIASPGGPAPATRRGSRTFSVDFRPAPAQLVPARDGAAADADAPYAQAGGGPPGARAHTEVVLDSVELCGRRGLRLDDPGEPRPPTVQEDLRGLACSASTATWGAGAPSRAVRGSSRNEQFRYEGRQTMSGEVLPRGTSRARRHPRRSPSLRPELGGRGLRLAEALPPAVRGRAGPRRRWSRANGKGQARRAPVHVPASERRYSPLLLEAAGPHERGGGRRGREECRFGDQPPGSSTRFNVPEELAGCSTAGAEAKSVLRAGRGRDLPAPGDRGAPVEPAPRPGGTTRYDDGHRGRVPRGWRGAAVGPRSLEGSRTPPGSRGSPGTSDRGSRPAPRPAHPAPTCLALKPLPDGVRRPRPPVPP